MIDAEPKPAARRATESPRPRASAGGVPCAALLAFLVALAFGAAPARAQEGSDLRLTGEARVGVEPRAPGSPFFRALVLEVELVAAAPGPVRLAGRLVDLEGMEIARGETEAALRIGRNGVPLRFSGAAIHEAGRPGPWAVADLVLYGESGQVLARGAVRRSVVGLAPERFGAEAARIWLPLALGGGGGPGAAPAAPTALWRVTPAAPAEPSQALQPTPESTPPGPAPSETPAEPSPAPTSTPPPTPTVTPTATSTPSPTPDAPRRDPTAEIPSPPLPPGASPTTLPAPGTPTATPVQSPSATPISSPSATPSGAPSPSPSPPPSETSTAAPSATPPPSATPDAPAPPPSSTPPPTATPPAPTPTAGAGPLPTPTLAAGPDWLAWLNHHRALAGLPPAAENAAWSAGGALHSRYCALNDTIAHGEDPSNSHYTPEGDLAGRNGNVFVYPQPERPARLAIDTWMSGPFHALGILEPGLARTGFGEHSDGSGWVRYAATLDVLRGVGPVPAGVGYPVRYPEDGMTIPLLRYEGNEWPDPLSACAGYSAPTGPPILLQLGQGNLSPDVTASAFEREGQALAHCVFDETSYQSPDPSQRQMGRAGLGQRDAVALIPREPLVPGARYTVEIVESGTTHRWSFWAGE